MKPLVRPEDGAQPIDFDDESKVLVSRHARSKRVLFVFTGNDNQMWVTLDLIHKVLSQLDWNIVYLRDPAKLVGYGYGLKQFGSSFRETISGMKDLVRSLGGGKVYCVGNSSGAYAALRYGLDLKATSVLVFAPTTLNARDHGPAEKRGNTLTEIAAAGGFFSDIRKAYARHDSVPGVRIVYGEKYEDDARTATSIADLPGITLEPLEDFDRHDVIAELIIQGRLLHSFTELWNGRRVHTSEHNGERIQPATTGLA